MIAFIMIIFQKSLSTLVSSKVQVQVLGVRPKALQPASKRISISQFRFREEGKEMASTIQYLK